ncbi:DUF3558 family protein [Gordonia westfalica]|uniref:DUF3558 domain-containing protein n=1 Tax=Gordonia westfalica TaxID=158898 RepID=A0A1H2HAV7_9ACTN|nr:DUF3558 family protein [Gordonia westfalica]SDU28932.1 Protein of unknown function [Gordonia westfalica]
MVPQTLKRRSPFWVLAVVILSYTLVGCSVAGSPEAAPSTSNTVPTEPEVRQTDDEGKALPFLTPFPNRWNANNDGTSYEPCTEVQDGDLQRSGLIPGSVTDVAKSDFQTARGCRWTFRDDGRSSLSQSIGNLSHPEQGVLGYKRENSETMRWYPDVVLDGRTVVVGSLSPIECTATVQSGKAIVGTTVVRLGENKPAPEEMCETALGFLRSTLARIPN